MPQGADGGLRRFAPNPPYELGTMVMGFTVGAFQKPISVSSMSMRHAGDLGRRIPSMCIKSHAYLARVYFRRPLPRRLPVNYPLGPREFIALHTHHLPHHLLRD